MLSADEIGQVARAFDQVHSEAIRLAGNEAMLRNSFNALFVNLSRRSQSLIERLARTIDSLEQNEEDPDRLSNLFAMDHMVTRMRRNSENLLLLAGHESARKWSEPAPLADVARAAISEIEQYSRVTLNIQPGLAVSGQAVSDVVRLLAEIIENATIFSPKDTQVRVSAQELTSGGVLIEVSDSGVGVSYARLAEINRRLDDPPEIDASVARHMGLFAVGRLAERHGVRVRLRAGNPRGLSALVWLPDSLIERSIRPYAGWTQPFAAQSDFKTGQSGALAGPSALQSGPSDLPAGRTAGRHSIPAYSGADGRSTNDRPNGNGVPAQNGAGPRETVPAAAPSTSSWFTSRRPSATATAGNGSSPSGGALPAGGGAPSGAGLPSGPDGWAESRHAAEIISDPVRSDRTVNGLPVRVPRANLIPGSVGGGRPPEGGGGGRHPADGQEAQTPAVPAPHRSPDLARSRLSGFQRGARRAEGQPPRTGEEADR